MTGLQVPELWHWSNAVHVTRLPLMHELFWHLSFVVQALPSAHGVVLILPLHELVGVVPGHAMHS